MVVHAPHLHVHRLATVAVADHDGTALGGRLPMSPDWAGLFDIRQSAGQHAILAEFDNTTQPHLL